MTPHHRVPGDRIEVFMAAPPSNIAESDGGAPDSAGLGVATPDVLDLPAGGECWFVLRTLARREHKIARTCEHRAIRHYLPLRASRNGTRGGRLAVPLFPGYLFACLAPETRSDLLRSGMIAQVIPVPRPRLLLAELRQVRTALEAGADLAPVPAIERKMRVRVIAGRLAGVEGRVSERRVRRGRLWLVLNVTMLGQGARVVVDVDDVEPLHADRGRCEVEFAGYRYA
jgi:hypothetical protein